MIVRLQKQNRSIRERAGTLGAAKSTVWYILRIKDRTGELRNIKRSGRPRRTTVVDDRRILSMVKKNPFTTSNQEKNTLQEADVSTIKRRLHQSKYRGFTTSCKQGQIRLCQKTSKKARPLLENHSLDGWHKINLYQNDGKKAWSSSWSKHTASSVKHGAVWSWAAWLPVALSYCCLVMMRQRTEVFSDDETEDRSV